MECTALPTAAATQTLHHYTLNSSKLAITTNGSNGQQLCTTSHPSLGLNSNRCYHTQLNRGTEPLKCYHKPVPRPQVVPECLFVSTSHTQAIY